MKQEDKKKDKQLDPEVIERFMEARRMALQALNDRLSKEARNEWKDR